MKRKCFLFTYSFPFGKSEPFLESEISFIANRFEKVYIFALNENKNEIQTRETPSNVISFAINCKQGRILNTIRGFFVKKNKFYFKKTKKTFLQRIADYYALGRFYKAGKRIVNIIKQDSISINNSVFYSYWLNASLLFVFLKEFFNVCDNQNISFIARAHGFDLYEERNLISYLPFQPECLNNLDYVCPISNHGRDYLIQKYPNKERIVFVHRLGTKDYGSQNIKSNNNVIRFVTCGSFYKIKRTLLFAKAFKLLSLVHKNIFWDSFGDGPQMKSVRNFINRNRLNNIVYLHGRIKNKSIYDFYKNNYISFFINVSTVEGVPVSIMEAMSFGIPCVATKVGGTPEIVNSKNGYLIKPELTDCELMKILQYAIEDADYENKRKQARITWESVSSADKNYEEWVDFISK